MFFLILSIISSTMIVIVFKAIDHYKVRLMPAILINYVVAASFGFLLSSRESNIFSNSEWLPFSLILGCLFIVMFYLIGISTQKAGISVTTIATRMALIIPVVFSIIFYQESISISKTLIFLLAFLSVLLSVYPDHFDVKSRNRIILPLLIFFGAGTVDSLIKFTQDKYLNTNGLAAFTAVLFTVAVMIAIITLIASKQLTKSNFGGKTVFWGIMLGLANYGSIFFFVKALNSNVFESSVIFGLNHIGIISLSVFLALLIFSERLKTINWIGIAMAIISLILLSRLT